MFILVSGSFSFLLKGSVTGLTMVEAGVLFGGVGAHAGVLPSSRLFLPGVGLKPSRLDTGGAGIRVGPKVTRFGVCKRRSEACAIGRVGRLVKALVSAAWLGCVMDTVCG